MQEGLAHLSANLTSLGGQVSEAISAGTKRIETTAKEPPDQKVLVQHSVPRVMTDLIRSQFQLLYDGLRPVLEASALNATQLESLRKSIDDCLQGYRELRDEIEQAESEQAENESS
jgi:hypothetical protein